MNKVYAWAIFIMALMVVSCNDESTIGDSIQPDSDKISVYRFDSIPFSVTTNLADSIRTDKLNDFLFGGYHDDDFGTVRGHIVTQLRFNSLGAILDTASEEQRKNIVLDSIYFILPYLSTYGEDMSLSEVQIFELKNAITNELPYYSNYDLESAYDEGELLGSLSYRAAQPNDSIAYSSSYYVNALRVPLKIELAERLFADVDQYKDSYETFQEYFKGLVIKSSFGSRSLIQASVTNISGLRYDMRMQLNYHDSTEWDTALVISDTIPSISDPEEDSLLYDTVLYNPQYSAQFYVNEECGRISAMEHQVDTAALYAAFGDGYSFVRGAGGLRTRITFDKPFSEFSEFAPLEGEDSSRIVINSAKIKFNIDYQRINVNRVIPPDNIAVYIDDGTVLSRIPDQVQIGWDYFGGDLDNTDFSYTINIADFLQRVLDGEYKDSPKTTPDLVVAIIDSDHSARSEAYLPYYTAFNTDKHPDNPMTFKVVYTRY